MELAIDPAEKCDDASTIAFTLVALLRSLGHNLEI
jgi:hypothetical protein